MASKIRKTKSVRTIALPVWLPAQGQGMLRITEDGVVDNYLVSEAHAGAGRRFYLVKSGSDQDTPYTTIVNGDFSSCTCKGWRGHGLCRHVSGLSALIAQKKL